MKKPFIAAGMATMPSRGDTAPRAIASVLPNVDRLYLFLDRFEMVPDYALDPKVEVLRSQDYGDLKANGKLLGLWLDEDADYYLCCDDDIAYPADFGNRMVAACRRRGNRSVVGVHGSRFKKPFRSYFEDRRIYFSRNRLRLPRRVDIIATNGCLHATSALRFDVRQWQQVNMVDLHFTLEARRAKLGLSVVAKQLNWVEVLGKDQVDSIFTALVKDDSRQTAIAHELMRLSSG